MTNPEELHRRFTGWPTRTWLILLAVLIVGGALSTRYGGPAWRAVKNWRADQFLAESEELLARNQVSLAFERARSALQLVPWRADAIRMNARLLSKAGSEAGLVLWQRLLASGDATPEDRAAFVEAALAMERPDLAAPELPSLVGSSGADDRAHRLAALFHLQSSSPGEAIRHGREAHRLAPSNPTNALLLATLLSRHPDPADPAAPRALYWQVATNPGPLQPEALRNLVTNLHTTRPERERLLAILPGLTNEFPELDVLVAEARIRLDPSRESMVISNLVAGLRREDWPQLARVVSLLQRLGRHEDVLRLTTGGRSLARRDLFMARYEALVARGQPEEAYRHLLIRDAPLPEFDLEIARARGAHEAGNFQGRDAHLRELLRFAGDHPLRIRRAAELAEVADSEAARGVARDAWQRLAAMPGHETTALRRLQRLADRAGDTWTAREHARRALRAGVTDSDLPLEIAYYDLLLEEDPTAALAEAQRRIADDPDHLFARAVAALAHLRRGEPDLAREVLDRVVVTPSSVRPEALAVLAATYGAHGLDGRAREIARLLPLARLRPEEVALVRAWIVPPPLGAPAHP